MYKKRGNNDEYCGKYLGQDIAIDKNNILCSLKLKGEIVRQGGYIRKIKEHFQK